MKSFSTWMLLFLVLAGAIVWLAVVVGLPQPYIGMAVLVLLVPAVVAVVVALRRRLPRR